MWTKRINGRSLKKKNEDEDEKNEKNKKKKTLSAVSDYL